LHKLFKKQNMVKSLEEKTLNDALEYFQIKKLPIEWDGKFEFTQCIIKVKKMAGFVYCIGKYNEKSETKVSVVNDLSKGACGMVVKYEKIYPIATTHKDNAIKVNESDVFNDNGNKYFLPELITKDDAMQWLIDRGEKAQGIHFSSDAKLRDRIIKRIEKDKKEKI